MFFYETFCGTYDGYFFLSSQPKTLIPIEFYFSILWMSLAFTGIFMSLKSSLLEKYFSAFVNLAGLRSSACNYLSKQLLRY